LAKPLKLISIAVSGKTKQTWQTPQDLYEKLNEEFHFDFDPCPHNPEINGIFVENWGNSNFVNPPYGRPIRSWLEKGLIEARKGKTCVFLIPSYTDVKWFHEIVLPFAEEIRFLKGRLKFVGAKDSAPFASMVVVFNSSKRVESLTVQSN
jgi:site-specific DNA-methyltransferase (adenine-specific)